MTQYNIMLYATDELMDHCQAEYGNETESLERIQTYLEGAYDRVDGHSCSVAYSSRRIDAPVENYGEGFCTSTKCGSTKVYCGDPHAEYMYAGLLDWFESYSDCENLYEADDCTMLVTAGRSDEGSPWIGGGVARHSSGFAVVVTGILAPEAPESYREHGAGGEYKAVRTAHHELGHLMMGPVDNSHDRGETVWRSTDYCPMTPMYVQGDENECEKPACSAHDNEWEQTWSDCCIREW